MATWQQPSHRAPTSNLLLASISEAAAASGHHLTGLLLPAPLPGHPPHFSGPRKYSLRSAPFDLHTLSDATPIFAHSATALLSASPPPPPPPASAAPAAAATGESTSGRPDCLWPDAAWVPRDGQTHPSVHTRKLLDHASASFAVALPQRRGHGQHIARQVQQFLTTLQARSAILQQPVDCGERQLAHRILDSPMGPKIAFLAGVHALLSTQVDKVRRHLPRPRRMRGNSRGAAAGGVNGSAKEGRGRDSGAAAIAAAAAAAAVAAIAAANAAAAAAAAAAADAEREVERQYSLGLAAEKDIRPKDAADHFEAVAAARPTDCAVLCLWSKQLSDCSYMLGVPQHEIVAANTKAIEIALRAVSVAPQSPLGYVACCVSRGRLALVSDNRTKLNLAKDAQDDAEVALKLDARSDIAHHLMGRWHYEMAGVNYLCRALVRIIYGAALFPGTYQGALQHYATASQLSPDRMIHVVEIGRTLHKLGDHSGARRQLERSLGLEVEDVNAQSSRRDAEELLAMLRRHHAHALTQEGPGLLAAVTPLLLTSAAEDDAAAAAAAMAATEAAGTRARAVGAVSRQAGSRSVVGGKEGPTAAPREEQGGASGGEGSD